MESKEIIFKAMVMFPEILQDAIDKHNHFNKTDFEIIETVEEIEVCFCKVRVTKYKIEDIFDLGRLLSGIENEKRQKGEIDW